MLSAELVIIQRKGQELRLPNLQGKAGETVRYWAQQVLDTARECTGLPRQEFSALVQVMGDTQQLRKLTRGLAKILEDACTFDEADPEQSVNLRRALFLQAAADRRAATEAEPWSRAATVSTVCQQQGWAESTIDEVLYADLPGAQRLRAVPAWTDQDLFERYDEARVQSVLLRATQVRVLFEKTSPAALRSLFHQLKFRQLLYVSERVGEQGLRLTLDGPLSLFESGTRYGLQLALMLPALKAIGAFQLQADVRWGKSRSTLAFTLQGVPSAGSSAQVPQQQEEDGELGQLLQDLRALQSPFAVEPASRVIDLPGAGICVPDLTFTHRDDPSIQVHFELLGYWSRAAVWQRIELAQSGLSEPVVFGVNQRLRVSEQVLEKDVPALIYVFRGTPNARTVLSHVQELATHPSSEARKKSRKKPVPRA